jgi:uncharacterized protein CbrC (UPF0167 family)
MQMNNYMARYIELSKVFHANRSPESVEALYALADELKDTGVTGTEALSNTYALLGLHQSAYDVFLLIYDENDMKRRKKYYTLRDLAQSRGNDFAVKRPKKKDRSLQAGEAALPKFRYFPDPIGCGVFIRTKEGETIICPCCGKRTDYYGTRMYARENVDHLCPACIASGAAAKKYDGDFIQDAEEVSDQGKTDELFRRTPGYVSWQGEHWLAHCDDYMAYLGDVGVDELERMGIWQEVLDEYATHDEMDVEYVRTDLQAGGTMAGYLFRCLHCGTYRLWVDLD